MQNSDEIMKKTILSLVLLLAGLSSQAATRLAGSKLESYTITYSSKAEPEEGVKIARYLQAQLQAPKSDMLRLMADQSKGNRIQFTHSKDIKLFAYRISAQKGLVTVDGGGHWAMQKASRIIAERLQKGGIAPGFSVQGTVEGEYLFPMTKGANLRILDDNILNYRPDTIPPAWQKINADCRNKVRAPQYVQLVRAYMPDVITMQEYGYKMGKRFYPGIQKFGYQMAYDKGTEDAWDNTPIFYNKERLELIHVNYVLFTPICWAAHSKGFTSAIFKQKSTGKVFGVVSTHLWWKGEGAQVGSDLARLAQACLLMAEVEVLKKEYGCTFFVCGDMNSYEDSPAIQKFFQMGYKPCYKAAVLSANMDNGHHVCGPLEGFSRKSNRRSPERPLGAIDHCFIYNPQPEATVQSFDCDQSAFIVPLTDHYPNIIDAHL